MRDNNVKVAQKAVRKAVKAKKDGLGQTFVTVPIKDIFEADVHAFEMVVKGIAHSSYLEAKILPVVDFVPLKEQKLTVLFTSHKDVKVRL